MNTPTTTKMSIRPAYAPIDTDTITVPGGEASNELELLPVAKTFLARDDALPTAWPRPIAAETPATAVMTRIENRGPWRHERMPELAMKGIVLGRVCPG